MTLRRPAALRDCVDLSPHAARDQQAVGGVPHTADPACATKRPEASVMSVGA